MNEPALHPSRPLKAMAWLAKWSLGSLLVALVLLVASWGTLHGWIVPRIGDYRVQLEKQAEAALGIPVRIGALHARSGGLIPTIELSDVALLDTEGRTALRLQRVVLAVSPRSLWRLGFEQLYIERPELDIRRTADGRIFIAGLPFSDTAAGDTRAADWLFSQTELVVRGGTVRWHDELRAAPMLALDQVDVLVQNGNWRHSVRVEASPPAEWGERFMLVGKFRQPLLSIRSGHWERWSGQAFARFARIDVARLRLYTDLGKSVASGRGALHAWLDVERGRAVGGIADVALSDVNATLGEKLSPLVLPSLQGRLGGRVLQGGFEFSTQGLAFVTDGGLRWPGGNMQLKYSDTGGRGGTGGRKHGQGELNADRMDLAALSRIAERLPLGDKAHQALRIYAPKGQVEHLKAFWQGPFEAMESYQVMARVSELELGVGTLPAAQSGAGAERGGIAPPTTLGLRGAAVDLEMTQAGGKASLAIADGALLLPGIFEDPWVPLTSLRSAVRWQVDGKKVAVQVAETQFANRDAQGVLRATWRTSDNTAARGRSRLPGVLDLNGKLVRADGTRVHRYLPLAISEQARHYVRDAVVAGKATSVEFKVQGDLHDMPFVDSRQGIFRIAAQVKDVTYAYVPQRLQQQGELPWPALKNLAGELVFERASMRINSAKGIFEGARAVQLNQVQAHIPDLGHAVVQVSAEALGPLAEMLGVVKVSPLSALTGHALDRATADGNAALRLNLSLPVANLPQTRVRGSIVLAGNGVRILPDIPELARARGTVDFTENSFVLKGMQARTLGGDMQLEGEMKALPPSAPPAQSALQLRAQGVASAQGLHGAKELGFLSQLAHHASGSASYTMELTLRRGVPELLVNSTLQGLGLDLPAPFAKSAAEALPVRFERALTSAALRPAKTAESTPSPLHDQLKLQLGRWGEFVYVRDLSGVQPRVLRGSIALGLRPEEVAPLPLQGVIANLQLGQADLDAWQALLSGSFAEASAPAYSASGATASAGPDDLDASNFLTGYLPTTVAVRAAAIKIQGRTLHQVVIGAMHAGSSWSASLDARELGGYIQYHEAGSQRYPEGRLFARLARLALPHDDSLQKNGPLLDSSIASLPALDIVVDEFELAGRNLGRLEVQAVNRPSPQAADQREWQLSKFNMTMPEATLTANGRWTLRRRTGALAASLVEREKKTELNFRLDIQDTGRLLQRFGMADVIRNGKGRVDGQIEWPGTPFSPDYASMHGLLQMNIGSGQFLKAEPGVAKLLSVLSLQSLPRRLSLDFRDVFSKGFAFDFVRGDVRLKQGMATTNNLQMKGVNAAVLMEGQVDLVAETQSLHVVVVPEINAMTASLVATAINPLIGLGSFLAQAFLRGPLMAAATQEFHIKGSWVDPQVTKLAKRGFEPRSNVTREDEIDNLVNSQSMEKNSSAASFQ